MHPDDYANFCGKCREEWYGPYADHLCPAGRIYPPAYLSNEMMVGGNDVIVVIDVRSIVQRAVRGAVAEKWSVYAEIEESRDSFFFEDKQALDSWNKDGRTDENADKMIHVIYGVSPQNPITVVTDGPQTEAILRIIKRELGEPS